MHRTIALLHVILLPYIQDEIQGADVVSKALHYVFAKDRDFQDYLKSSLARHVTPTLRVRKVNVTTDRKKACSQCRRRGGGDGIRAGAEANMTERDDGTMRALQPRSL